MEKDRTVAPRAYLVSLHPFRRRPVSILTGTLHGIPSNTRLFFSLFLLQAINQLLSSPHPPPRPTLNSRHLSALTRCVCVGMRTPCASEHFHLGGHLLVLARYLPNIQLPLLRIDVILLYASMLQESSRACSSPADHSRCVHGTRQAICSRSTPS